MLLGTVRNSSQFLTENGEAFERIDFGEISLLVNDFGKKQRGLFEKASGRFTFTSEQPYLKSNPATERLK